MCTQPDNSGRTKKHQQVDQVPDKTNEKLSSICCSNVTQRQTANDGPQDLSATKHALSGPIPGWPSTRHLVIHHVGPCAGHHARHVPDRPYEILGPCGPAQEERHVEHIYLARI